MRVPGPREQQAEREMMGEVVADLERTYLRNNSAVYYAALRFNVED